MKYSPVDHVRNGIYHTARVHLALLLEEGLPLPEVVKYAGDLQACIHRALHHATASATIEMTGMPPEPPNFGQGQGPGQAPPEGQQDPEDGFSPENPFAP